MKEFVMAAVQFAPDLNDIKANMEKGCFWLEKAVKEYNAQVVAFPESITTGFTPACPLDKFYEMLDFIPGFATELIQKAAKSYKTYVVWPIYEKGEEKNVIYNTAVLIGPQGEIIGRYRKTHPFPTERLSSGGWTTPGKEVPVFDTELAKIGIVICYDGDFPELSRVLALKGAEVIIRPSAFLRSFEIWELTNRARAYDNHVYFIGINSVGKDAGNNYYFGSSMIVNPIGYKLAQARGTEEIIAVSLSPEPLKYVTYGSHSPMCFDHLEDRNTEVYHEILRKGKSSFEPSKRIPYL